MVETVGGWLVIKSRVPLCVIPFELRDVSNPDSHVMSGFVGIVLQRPLCKDRELQYITFCSKAQIRITVLVLSAGIGTFSHVYTVVYR